MEHLLGVVYWVAAIAQLLNASRLIGDALAEQRNITLGFGQMLFHGGHAAQSSEAAASQPVGHPRLGDGGEAQGCSAGICPAPSLQLPERGGASWHGYG